MLDYLTVTELAGTKASQEQILRMCNRYYWAGQYCKNKDVLEVACGTGQGIGYLSNISNSFEAGDYSEKILDIAKKYYGNRVKLKSFNAENMPYDYNSKDIIIIFEAIYYLRDINKFLKECKRVLREGGKLLISSVNKDLYDFFPSEYSYRYYGVIELGNLLKESGFEVKFYGETPINNSSLREKIFRAIKFICIRSGMVPKTMDKKKKFKRIMYGKLVDMPQEICSGMVKYIEPNLLEDDKLDKSHKGIYCEATLLEK